MKNFKYILVQEYMNEITVFATNHETGYRFPVKQYTETTKEKAVNAYKAEYQLDDEYPVLDW